MNRLRLKLIGLVVPIFAVIVGICLLCPRESPPAEQASKQEETVSKPQTNVKKAKTNADSAAGKSTLRTASEFENRKVEQIARTAESLKTVYRNPATPEAAKARQSLLRLPEGFAKSAPGSAAEKEAIAKFLNKTRVSIQQRNSAAPGNSVSRTVTAARPYAQPSGAGQAESSTGSSPPAMSDHLKSYKATRNELFPMYHGTLPTGLTGYLPGPYRQQVARSQAQKDTARASGFEPATARKSSSGSSTPISRPTGPSGTTKAVKSFKSYKADTTRKPSTTDEPQSTTTSTQPVSR